jgi:Ca2+-binding RTX toxin-like protein
MADWKTNIDLIQKLYIAFYGRPADPGGLRYWASQLPDNAAPDSAAVRDLISRFINSQEAQDRFGSPSLNSAIARIYTYAFHRDATDADKAKYAGKTVVDVLVDVISVSYGPDYGTLNEKLQYAKWFTQYLDPNGDGIPNDDPTGTKFTATFYGNTDAETAKSKLHEISLANPAVQSKVLEDVKAIADPGDAILTTPPPTGQIFTLTANIDTLTGTSYNDVFIGDNSGATKLVQMADSINGSGGDDTFKYYGYNGVLPQMKSIETLHLIGAITGIDTTSLTDLKNIVVERWAAGATQTITYLSTQSLDFVNNNNTKIINLQPDTGSKIAVTLDSNSGLYLGVTATAVDGTKITELDLTAVGTNKGVIVDQALSNLTTVKILGDGSIELTNKAGKITYDASGNKGGVTVDVTATGNILSKFIGSSGVDTLKSAVNYTTLLDTQLQNVENIILTGTKNINVKLGSQTEGFNITGNTGNNTIIGSQGADTINAGKGNDIIRGGAGADTITTGAGTDSIIFDDFRTADKITDFTSGTDKLIIDWKSNTKALNYLLNTKAFVVGTKVKVKAVQGANTITTKTLAAGTKLTVVTNLTTGGAIKLGGKNVPLVSVKNYTKLYTLLGSVAVNKSNANALVFARTTAQGKLYFGAIIDNHIGTKGLLLGDKITIKTLATVTGSFTANDIYIM